MFTTSFSLSSIHCQVRPRPRPSCVGGAPQPLLVLQLLVRSSIMVFFFHCNYGDTNAIWFAAGGADIIRVHDVKEQGEVIKMADAIYRSRTVK